MSVSPPEAAKAIMVARMKVVLQAACIDDVDSDDPSRAKRVVIGRYVGSITRDRLAIEIHPQHPLGPQREERRQTQGTEQSDANTWDLPPETLGGSKFRWERGTVQIRCHIREPREDAVPIIQAVAARVKVALETAPTLIGFKDDFGFSVHALEVTDDYSFTNEAGDPSTERVFVDWRFLTSYKRARQ